MILFVYANFSTFVKNDYEILKKRSEIKKHHYHQGKTLLAHLVSQTKLFFWLLTNIWTCDKIFCWFADYHSFLLALFSKIFHKNFTLRFSVYHNSADYTYNPYLLLHMVWPVVSKTVCHKWPLGSTFFLLRIVSDMGI